MQEYGQDVTQVKEIDINSNRAVLRENELVENQKDQPRNQTNSSDKSKTETEQRDTEIQME